jgi:hypothetical protein
MQLVNGVLVNIYVNVVIKLNQPPLTPEDECVASFFSGDRLSPAAGRVASATERIVSTPSFTLLPFGISKTYGTT